MNYVDKVLAELIAKNPAQPEFHQAATEVQIGRASCRERV